MFLYTQALTFTGTTTRVSQALTCQTLSKVCAIVTADIATGTWTAGLQGSNDGTTWVALDTPTALVDNVALLVTKADVAAQYVRVSVVTGDAGTLTSLAASFHAKF